MCIRDSARVGHRVILRLVCADEPAAGRLKLFVNRAERVAERVGVGFAVAAAEERYQMCIRDSLRFQVSPAARFPMFRYFATGRVPLSLPKTKETYGTQDRNILRELDRNDPIPVSYTHLSITETDPRIEDVHHVHIWAISTTQNALTRCV